MLAYACSFFSLNMVPVIGSSTLHVATTLGQLCYICLPIKHRPLGINGNPYVADPYDVHMVHLTFLPMHSSFLCCCMPPLQMCAFCNWPYLSVSFSECGESPSLSNNGSINCCWLTQGSNVVPSWEGTLYGNIKKGRRNTLNAVSTHYLCVNCTNQSWPIGCDEGLNTNLLH